MSRAKGLFIGMAATIIPFLFAINIIRVIATDDPKNTIGTNQMISTIQDINVDFTGTLYQIALTGASWKALGEEFEKADAGEDLGQWLTLLFNALWQTIILPIQIIADLINTIYECFMVFISFVGFVPTPT